MTCIKTGASVYFENYGCAYAADVYQVGVCRVVRFNSASARYRAPLETDWVVLNWFDDSTVWMRADIGVAVVPANLLSAPP